MRISESEQNCTTPKSRNSECEQQQNTTTTGENYNSPSRRNSKHIEKRKSVLKDNIEDAETLTESKNGFEAKSDETIGPKKPKSDIKNTESKIDQKESKSSPQKVVTEPKVDPKEAKSDTKIQDQKEPLVTKNEPVKLEVEKSPKIEEIMTNPDQALAKSDSGFSEKVQDDDEVDDAPLVKKEELSLEKAKNLYVKRVQAAAFFNEDFDDLDDLDDDDDDSVINGTFFKMVSCFQCFSQFKNELLYLDLLLLQMESDCEMNIGEETSEVIHLVVVPQIHPRKALTSTFVILK